MKFAATIAMLETKLAQMSSRPTTLSGPKGVPPLDQWQAEGDPSDPEATSAGEPGWADVEDDHGHGDIAYEVEDDLNDDRNDGSEIDPSGDPDDNLGNIED